MCIRDSFNAAAFLIGWLGESELAAHAIAIQIASVTFMIPYGVAQAATVRVGYAQGAGDSVGVTRAGWSAFGPVSYTHLDVYKRQARWCPGPRRNSRPRG